MTFVGEGLLERCAHGFGALAYTSQTVFEAERETIFLSRWSAMAFTSDLPRPGSVHPLTFMEMPVLLVRHQDGTLRGFHNACAHRGAPLAICSGQHHALRCPYHGWVYDLDGKLRATPNIGGPGEHGPSGFSSGGVSLKPFAVAEIFGVVFGNFSASPQPLTSQIQPLLDRWHRYDLSLLRYAGGFDLTINANWKLLVENFCEAYHSHTVHPTLRTYAAGHQPLIADGCFVGESSSFFDGLDGGEACRLPVADPMPCFPGLLANDLTTQDNIALFPNLLMGWIADRFTALIINPTGPETSRERFGVFVVGDEGLHERFAGALTQEISRRREINDEDVAMVEQVQKSRHSVLGFDGGLFVPAREASLWAFQHMVARCLAAG